MLSALANQSTRIATAASPAPRRAALMTNSMNTLALPPSMTREPGASAITSGPAPMTRSRSGAKYAPAHLTR